MTAGDLLEEWAAAWNAGDVARIVRLFTEDCLYEDVPLGRVMKGHRQLEAFAEGFLWNVREVRFELTSSVSGKDSAAGEWMMTGTHQGELAGLPRADRPVRLRGVTVVRRRGERLERCVDYWDRSAYLAQLGVSP